MGLTIKIYLCCTQWVVFNEELNYLYHLTHRDPVFSKIERCDEALENVGFAWLSTRKVAKELLDSLEALNDKREPLRQAVYAVDASLGIADEDSLKDWFFWRLAGHPSVPADEEMFQSLASIAALCRSITQGAKGVASLHDLCTNCPNQAIAWDKLTKDVDCQLLEDMGEYIIAALSSNTKLRHEVLHGLALLWTACTTPALPRDITTSSISNELWDATARLLEAGQTAWYLQGDGTQSEPGFLLGKTDLYLPTNMLTRNSNRSIQTSLYAFSDAPLSRKQLVMLAGMDCPLLAMLSLGIDHSQPEVTRLQFLADCIGATPSRDIREAIPYLLLSWLGTDTSRSSVSEIPPESRNVIRQSLVHDAWFNWLRGLWSLGPSTLANRSVREARLTPDAPISRGPCLLHLCSSTSQLCSILQDSSAVPIAESLGHYLRLQLVARHLRELTTSPDQNYKSVTVAEWKAATLIAGSTVHSLLAEQLGSDTSDGIVCLLIRAKYPGDISSSQIWEKVSLALGASNHRNLWRAELTILPALQLLQYPSVTEATNVGMNLRGRVYILLGLSRLQMSVPPPGSDPAKVYKLQEQRLMHEVEWDVDLQLQVREEYEMVPGGPPQSSLVKNLLERRDTLLREATNLAGKSPWRPTPPQYLSLRSEIARFQANFADNDRLLLLVERLLASDRAAIEEAKAWMSTAEAMVDHLTREYPAYRDISQPFQLALEEMRYGFSLLITSLELEDVADLRAIEGLVADLLAFPHRKSKVGIITDISRAKHLAAKLIQQQTDKTQKETGVDYDTNTVKLQLELLRNFLWRMIQGWRFARTKPSQSELVSGFQHICCILLEYWEIAKVEEAKRAEEEAQLFKEKRRTETSDDEIDISILRENFSTFAEFIEDGDTVMEGDVGGQERDAKVSKAVYSAIDYITGDIIKDVIAIQSEMFDDQKVFADNMFTGSFLRSHNLGLAMVEFAGHRLTTCLDSMSNTGHLYATCLRGLSLMSSGTSSDRTSEEEGDLDIWVENPSEARLLTDVLGPLKKRVADLLAEWPDHPVLSQINAIITRLLSMSMRSPLKGLLTGIEILLSKAQLWEETAARHVSLQKQLKDVSGLSRRWRRLELNGWRTILRKTMGRVAEGAYSGWFHLFRILFNESEVSLESTALAVEEFIKLSPIGEYGTRINMVKVFQGHLKAVHEADEARKDRSTALASMLFNLTLYYGQFLPFVQKTIQSAIVPIEKELEDFVALAKWEDRGYYALQLSSEKAHKHLQKLKRKVADVLRQPVSNVIGEAAKLMGLDDLTLADSSGVSDRKSGEHYSSCVAAADILTNVDSFMLDFVEARTDKPDKRLPDNRLDPGKYTKNIPNLLGRFHKLALDGLQASAESCRRAVGSANDLASEAVERALILQKDVEKGAKARKKKALVDFLKALGDLGVSRLRTAVPINYRGPNAWLFLVRNLSAINTPLDYDI